MRSTLSTLVTLLAAAMAATAPAACASSPPSAAGGSQVGQVIAGRPVSLSQNVPARSWQLSYHSADVRDQPEVAVTTLIVPTAPWPGPGSRPAVSLQVAEDSTGVQCAPSKTLPTGSNIGQVEQLLRQGWAVAVPDYEGPQSEWMAGEQSGHAVLDGMRAAERFQPAGLGPGTRWGLLGYSGGAAATGWAAQLHRGYAPQLRVVGASMGGTPADLTAMLRAVDGGPFSGFEFAAMAGLHAAYPQIDLDSILDARGRADLQAAGGKCVRELLTEFSYRRLAGESTLADPAARPDIAALLRRNSLGGIPPDLPVFDYHADTDEIVPVAQDNALVRAWCGAGVPVTLLRDPRGEHVREAQRRAADAISYLADRFAGEPVRSDCASAP